MSIVTRFQNAWNAFTNREQGPPRNSYGYSDLGPNPSRIHASVRNERSMLVSVMARIAVDASSINIRHVQLDESDRYLEDKHSGLNNCFKWSANIDQTGTDFIRDAIMSMLDEGYVALVPIDTWGDPKTFRGAAFDFARPRPLSKEEDLSDNFPDDDEFNINTLRTGKIEEWYPDKVRVSVYNDKKGIRQSIIMPKACVAIIENPFYSVMNQPNSTMQRLIRKLRLLDNADDTAYSQRLDLLLQLPYTVRTENRKKQAKERMKELESDLKNSPLGIAFTDATEKAIPLSRPLENQLLPQIKELREQLLSELCITKEIMDGSANPDTMNNYFSRTIEPIIRAIVEECRRKFITRAGLFEGQSIMYFRDSFKLLPMNEIAKFVDSFNRNGVITRNETRALFGLKPNEDPTSDMLFNPNMPMQDQEIPMPQDGNDPGIEEMPPEG